MMAIPTPKFWSILRRNHDAVTADLGALGIVLNLLNPGALIGWSLGEWMVAREKAQAPQMEPEAAKALAWALSLPAIISDGMYKTSAK